MSEAAKRMRQSYKVSGDRWFLIAAEEIERQQKALYAIISLDHHNHGPESEATKIARAALSAGQRETEGNDR